MDLVLDSSFLVAAEIEHDAHHAAARKVMARIKGGEWDHLILCDHVLSETLTVVQSRGDHAAAVKYGNSLLESQQVTFLVAGDDIFEGLRVFTDEQQGTLSLVDCLLIHLARAYQAPIATFDKDLEAAPRVKVVPGPS